MLKVDRKVILVTRETRLQGLRKKYGTAGQARFAMSRGRRIELERGVVAQAPAAQREAAAAQAERDADQPFQALAEEEGRYQEAVGDLTSSLDLRDLGVPLQRVDRAFVPTMTFGPNDVVVCVGPDGLVANVAKYAVGRPIVGVNPDREHVDGVLLPFGPEQARMAVVAALKGKARTRDVTLARATLTDGQTLLAFNDLFVGCRTHVSARYRVGLGDAGAVERQSSSGIVVSTGAGATGWLSSFQNMAAGLARAFGGQAPPPRPKPEWEKRELMFVVREPFVSRASSAGIVAGTIVASAELVVESEMPESGVIFSDGVESDFLQFNAGATARIGVANERAILVTGY